MTFRLKKVKKALTYIFKVQNFAVIFPNPLSGWFGIEIYTISKV